MSKKISQQEVIALNLKHLNFWHDQLCEFESLDKVIVAEMLKSADIFLTDLKTLQEMYDEKE